MREWELRIALGLVFLLAIWLMSRFARK